MALKDRTKQLYADTLIELMEKKSLQEIRVKDLCEKSGTDRHTFYYHFRDKYELVAWIYASGAEKSMGGQDGFMGVDESAAALNLVQQNRVFYKKAFTDSSQNVLWQYIQEYNVEMYSNMLKRHYGLSELSEEVLFSLQYHCHGCLGLTYDWVMSDFPISAEELARRMTMVMPDVLKNVVS